MERLATTFAGAKRFLRQYWNRPRILVAEPLYRTRRACRRVQTRRGFDRIVTQVPAGAWLDLPDLDLPPFDDLPQPLKAPANQVLEDASAVAAHEMNFLGTGPIEYGRSINWLADPVTGYQWPKCFHSDIPVVDLGTRDDPKRVWELSRGHQLLILARASRLDPKGAPRWRAELEDQLASWIQANPVGRTINWTNPMEAGIRVTNWVTALALAGQKSFDCELMTKVTQSLQQHGRFIFNYLEGSPKLRSNHFVGNLLGLAVLGSTVVDDPQARRWRNAARKWLPREVSTQVNDDGGDFEASIPYHGLVLEMFSIGLYFLELHKDWKAPDGTKRRLEKMVNFGLGVRHPNGRAPQFGDGDSGRVLPLDFSRRPTLDPVLWSASSILGLPRPLSDAPDAEVAFNFGMDSWRNLEQLGMRPEPPPNYFPQSGIVVLDGPRSHAVIDCGGVGQSGNGGHAHNDALSLEWSLDGEDVIVDPGTFSYTSDAQARNLMRSTVLHPTPMIDGREINPIDADRLFQLDEVAAPEIQSLRDEDGRTILVATHGAYQDLDSPVTVKRTVILDRESSSLTIKDFLVGEGHHSVSMLFTLEPGWSAKRVSSQEVRLYRDRKRITVVVAGAKMDVTSSWYSPEFGKRELVAGLRVAAEDRRLAEITIHLKPS